MSIRIMPQSRNDDRAETIRCLTGDTGDGGVQAMWVAISVRQR